MDRASSRGEVSLSITAPSIAADLAALAAFGATPAGIDRRLFSAADRAARTQFVAWARADGRIVEQDRAGNVFARRAGRREGAAILSGSHLDTVPTGGAYDGAYGAVAALYALRALDADAVVTEHPVEAVAWAGEEGSRFPLGCLGSGAFAGLNPLAEIDALADDHGVRFADARAGADGLLRDVPVRDAFPRPAAYVEIHIEQGPVLERSGVRLGNVTAIAGQRRFDVEVRGESGHAGTVPMAMRRDPMGAAAAIILAIEAEAHARDGAAVLTVGRLVVEPNQTNVIAARVIFRVDARSVDDALLARLGDAVVAHAERIGRERNVDVRVTAIEQRAAVAMDAGLRTAIAGAIEALGFPSFDLPSGAGHDAMCVAAVAPAAMIFVPSVGGHSHTDAEYTSPADLDLGVAALTRSIAAIDRLLS